MLALFFAAVTIGAGINVALNLAAQDEPAGVGRNCVTYPGGEWTVCVFAPRTTVALFRSGGGLAAQIARQPEFTHRIAADSEADIVASLAGLRRAAAAAGARIVWVAVYDHAGPGEPRIAGVPLGQPFYDEILRCRRDVGTAYLLFLGCSVAEGEAGRSFVERKVRETGLVIIASTQAVLPLRIYLNLLGRRTSPWLEILLDDGRAREFRPGA